MQHSIFELPLYCLHADHPIMEAPKLSLPSQAPSLFTISPPSPSSSSLLALNSFDQEYISSSFLNALIITPSSSIKKATSEQDLTSDSIHLYNLPAPSHSETLSPCSINGNSSPDSLYKLPLSHSITLFTGGAPAAATVCSNSDADDNRKLCDDGSVASKLLSSITKSISSPSLQLTSCKEAARETPYQKTLKLKHLNLEHCAEPLGMESVDSSSFVCHDSQCIDQEKIGMEGNPSSFITPSFSTILPNSHQESSLKSVKSSPNLSSASPLSSLHHSRYTSRSSTSFPPPLSHTLPTSSSYDSLSISLRAYREDGRFILKETMVPSKRYFQANRTNGRLTLHFVTRAEEPEEEQFTGQADDHEEFSYSESQKENLSGLVEEEGFNPMCMVSLSYKETPGRSSFDNKLVELDSYNNNTNQSLNIEEVCVKKSLGMHSSKEINVAEYSHLDIMSLQRLNCILGNHNYNSNDSEDDDKRNVISNVITLSLQTSSQSKVTLHKAQLAVSFPHILSSYPDLVSSSLKQSAFIHSTGRNIEGFNLSRKHDMSTFPKSKENFIWESNLMPSGAVATLSGSRRPIQRKGGGGGSGDGGSGGEVAFVMEEMRAKNALMKAVSQLANSLIVEASGDWGLEGLKKKASLLRAIENGGIIGGGYAKDGKTIGKDGLNSDGANFDYYNTSYLNEEEKASDQCGGANNNNNNKELNITTLQFSCCNAINLQCEEWLHTLHCKELFDRHQLVGQGLMKLHCIPTKS